jgi:predicted dithiol-disulfide oxidoreductase (DUF899 family)
MTTHDIASRETWLVARKTLLAKEKEFTKLRDQLSEARRALPWVKIEDYVFDGPRGKLRLSDLFQGRHQLVIYHLMFHPDWSAACKSCSFWADNFDNITTHLKARDVSMAAVSRAPIEKLVAFKERMGWHFDWVSCGADGKFAHDFGVNFTPDELKRTGKNYNYGSMHFTIEDAPGLSVFYKDDDGSLFHTYSCYSRGLDMLNVAYHYLDIVPKGRDEASLKYHMDWVKLHDEYAK